MTDSFDDGPSDPLDHGALEESGPGQHPLIGRQAALVRALRVLGLAAWALAVAGVVLPGAVGRGAGVALVTLLICAPLARVAWLAVRWIRRGDPRFALAAAVLVLIASSGGFLAL